MRLAAQPVPPSPVPSPSLSATPLVPSVPARTVTPTPGAVTDPTTVVDVGVGASDTALGWVQVLAPAWVVLGVVLGFYLTSHARYAAFNEQHVRARVEAARDSFLAAHLAAYHIANRLRLDDEQELAELWTPELARQIDDLVWQLYDHEFMLDGRQARPVGATFREARKLIHEITRAAGKPDRTPATELTQRHREALTQLFRLLERAPHCWSEWEDAQWDRVRTRLARGYRKRRLRAANGPS